MTWSDVEDVLFDGNEEQVKSQRCPDCGGELSLSFDMETRRFTVECTKCGILNIYHGSPVPAYMQTTSKV